MLLLRQQNIVTKRNEGSESLAIEEVLVILEDAFPFHFHPRCVGVRVLG